MSKYRNKSKITEIIIHCAATPNGRRNTAADIDKWHGDREPPFIRNQAFIDPSHPFLHIGYHFVIGVDGEVELGRKLDETGAHAKGHNEQSIGICLVGNDKFTQSQWTLLEGLIRTIINDYPDIKIMGHNEISHKSCPGFDVQEYLANGMKPRDEHVL